MQTNKRVILTEADKAGTRFAFQKTVEFTRQELDKVGRDAYIESEVNRITEGAKSIYNMALDENDINSTREILTEVVDEALKTPNSMTSEEKRNIQMQERLAEVLGFTFPLILQAERVRRNKTMQEVQALFEKRLKEENPQTEEEADAFEVKIQEEMNAILSSLGGTVTIGRSNSLEGTEKLKKALGKAILNGNDTTLVMTVQNLKPKEL